MSGNDQKETAVELALVKYRLDEIEADVHDLRSEVSMQLKDLNDKLDQRFDSLQASVEARKETETKAASFARGAAWVVTGMCAVFMAFKDQLLRIFSGGN